MYTPPLPRPNFSHSDKNHIVDPPDGSPLRVYQVWKGRNKFICGGRLIFGPDVKSIFLTLSMIVVPVILFWSFVARELTEALPHPRGILILVLSIILIAHIIVLLLVTSGSDPGIIPRNSRPPEPDDCDTSSLSTDWASSQISQPGMPMTKNVTINGIIVKVKYCQTCMLYRPPRCSHCSICNNCVERFDHHCPWVGQCIGKRNYRYFFMFVSSTSLLCLYVLVCSLINITRIMNKYDVTFWRAIQKSPVSGILVMYTFVISWFVGGLTMFHVYLISTNQTTYENFRYQYDRRMNPYNLGFPSNCKEVFCSKIPSSKNDFRAMTKGDPSFGFSASSYSSQAIRQDKPIRSFDLEIGKRQGVVDGDDARNRVASFGKLERCSTEPRRNDWSQSIEWGVSPDKSMYTPEFGRNRIQGREDNDDRSPEFGRNRIQGREDNDDR